MSRTEYYRPINDDATQRIAEAFVDICAEHPDPVVSEIATYGRDRMVALLQAGIEEGYVVLFGPPLDDVDPGADVPVRLSYAPPSHDGEVLPLVFSENALPISRNDLHQSTEVHMRRLRENLPGLKEGNEGMD